MATMRLNNSNNIVADRIQLYSGGSYINVGNYLSSIVTVTDLAFKADKTTTYTKTDMDTALNLKASLSGLNTLSDTVVNGFLAVDTALALKATQSSTYTKTESDASLALKANTRGTYTRTSIDNALALKQGALSNTVAIIVSTRSCSSITAFSVLTSLSCVGDATFGGNIAITGNVTSTRFISNTARFYYHIYGSYNAGLYHIQVDYNLLSPIPYH